MSERVRKIVLVIILIAAAIWGYQNIFGKRQATHLEPLPRPTVAAAAVQPPTSADSKQLERPAEEVVEALYDEPWGSDPFRWKPAPSAAGPGQPTARPEWTLTGIFFSDRGPIAVINDRLVRVGETVDQAEVVDINKRQVTLRTGDKTRVLTIPNG